MSDNPLHIPKRRKEVMLWVHPDGQVFCDVFLATEERGEENPFDLFNRDEPFLVVFRKGPEQPCFYNRNAIIRVEYPESEGSGYPPDSGEPPLTCHLHLMDGSLIEGSIHESLPTDRARLFDYLNRREERFLRVLLEEGRTCLVNKSYINHVTLTGEESGPTGR